MLSVSVVIPAKNEQDNIAKLLSQVIPYGHDVLVVDDSDDATAFIAHQLGARVVEGKRKGLGQAIIDGINASKSDVVLVMDSDLSHSPKDIPRLLKPILEQGCDLTIGSRYCKGGDFSNWALDRKIKSIIGVKLMQLVTGVKDSNSGFFAFRKSILEGATLKPHSWKIMLEVLFKGKWMWREEVPITFNDRVEGVSKNNAREKIRHARHMLRLLVWKFRRYITFACVGGIGALWYFGVLYFLTEYVDIWYGFSAIIGTLVAITNNYFVNHYYTFRKEKEHNRSLFRGWLKYVGNSAMGDGVDWLLLVLMTEVFGLWYMLSALVASGAASVIKYTVAKKFIWGGKGRKAQDEDYEWHAFFKGLPWQKRWKRLIANIVREFAETDGKAGVVLDIGCGSSPQGLLVNHDHYIGVDKNRAKIEYMKSKKLTNCVFMHDAFLDAKIIGGEGHFDVALFVEVIEHLRDMDEARGVLGRIHEYLKPAGKLVVATPNFGGFMGRAMDKLYGMFQKGAYAEEHQLRFSLDSLEELCGEAGFKLVKYRMLSGADMVCLFEKR